MGKKESECMGSGSCKYAVFNRFFFMEEACFPDTEFDQFDFPLCIDEREQACLVEVIRLNATVGAAYS